MNTQTQASTDNPRSCLPCTACCDGWVSAEIEGVRVSAGHPCPHSTASGCGIYARRPQIPCRQFVCSWLVPDSPLPDWMRPDQCGAIVLLSMPWQGETVISAIPVGEAIPPRTLDWLQQYAQAHHRPLIFYRREKEDGQFSTLKRFGFGPPAFQQKVARLQAAAGEHNMAGDLLQGSGAG